jgi:hypothetical protein
VVVRNAEVVDGDAAWVMVDAAAEEVEEAALEAEQALARMQLAGSHELPAIHRPEGMLVRRVQRLDLAPPVGNLQHTQPARGPDKRGLDGLRPHAARSRIPRQHRLARLEALDAAGGPSRRMAIRPRGRSWPLAPLRPMGRQGKRGAAMQGGRAPPHSVL